MTSLILYEWDDDLIDQQPEMASEAFKKAGTG